MIGVEPENYFRIVTIPDYIIAGTPRLTSQDALIGTDLANDLGASIGDKLRVVTAAGGKPWKPPPAGPGLHAVRARAAATAASVVRSMGWRAGIG